MSTPTGVPTPAHLFDLMAARFGIGDFDDEVSRLPYFRYRMTEISKIRTMMKSRRVTAEELLLTIEYAVERRIPITAAWQVFNLVPDAIRETHRAKRAAAREAAAANVEALAAEAYEAGHHDWAARFMAATADAVAEVEAQYRVFRGRY